MRREFAPRDVAEHHRITGFLGRLGPVDIAVDRKVGATVLVEHVGDHLPDPAEAEDHRPPLGIRRRQFGRMVIDPPRRDPPESGEQRRDGHPDRGRRRPQRDRLAIENSRHPCRAKDDQRGFARAGHQQPGLGRDRHPRAGRAQQQPGHQRLDQQHRRQPAEQHRPLSEQRLHVDSHPDRDQEHAQREALERRDDDLDLLAVIGFGNDQPGDQCAEDRR